MLGTPLSVAVAMMHAENSDLSSSRPVTHVVQRLSECLLQYADAQNHDQKPNRDDDQQGEAEPPHDHGRSSDTTSHAAISKILCNRRGGYRGRMLPED